MLKQCFVITVPDTYPVPRSDLGLVGAELLFYQHESSLVTGRGSDKTTQGICEGMKGFPHCVHSTET